MLADHIGKKLTEYKNNYCIFDLETTGLYLDSDQVVEISAIKVIEGKVADEFSTLVNPNCHIPYSASSVNGITDKMVKDSPCFREALEDFLDFVGDLPLIGHNIISFDLKFIYRDCQRFWGKLIDNDFADTLYLARKALPSLQGYSLVNLAKYYGIDPDGAHRALVDCEMNQRVYELLVKEQLNPFKAEEEKICPKCGCMMKKRTGKFGVFWGCSGYPTCKYTCSIK